jgi:hypothetical protein
MPALVLEHLLPVDKELVAPCALEPRLLCAPRVLGGIFLSHFFLLLTVLALCNVALGG